MNQKSHFVVLRKFTVDDHPFGNIQGKETFAKLVDYIHKNSQDKVFGISLTKIKATDASFPRESVVSLAKHFRGDRWVYLDGMTDRDLIDNWKYAAIAKDQPLVIWNKQKFEVIGPEVSSATSSLIAYVLERGSVTASQVATDLDISVQNASTRLKKLVEQGYIMRTEEIAESGGIEYIYNAIR
jgi:hypothetical protein